jgi:uncharacterized protein YjbI with pentapeptide repeats
MPLPPLPLIDTAGPDGSPSLDKVAEGVQALWLYLSRLKAALDDFTPSQVAQALDTGALGVWAGSPVTGVTLPATVGAPDTPTGLQATGLWRQIALTWDLDPNPTITGWEVQRADDAAFLTNVVTLTSARALAYVDAGLPDSATRYYRIRALGTGGVSGYTAPVAGTTLASDATVLTQLSQAVLFLQRAHIREAVIDTARITDAAIVSAKIADAAVTTAKVQDAAITTAKIQDAAITNAKIADATITSAKIQSLSADKITTGTLSVLVNLGVGQIKLDGVNALITIDDTQATPKTRVKLGKLGSGSTQYGLQLYDASGALMWDSTNQGATSAGIKDLAVLTSKVANLAVQTGKLADVAVTTAKRQALTVQTFSQTVPAGSLHTFFVSGLNLGTTPNITLAVSENSAQLHRANYLVGYSDSTASIRYLNGGTVDAQITEAIGYW